MSGSTFFVQSCPVCGRHLEVRIRHLGKKVTCVHCGGGFVASDPEMANSRQSNAQIDLFCRAERLLNRTRNVM